MTPKELVLEAVAAIFINFDPTAAEQLLTPITAPNPSGHTQADGPITITDLEKTAEAFAPVDKAIEDDHVSKQPGFVSRVV